MNKKVEDYSSYEAIRKIPSSILKNVDELLEYQKHYIKLLVEKENIYICGSEVYSYSLTWCGKSWLLKNKVTQSNNRTIIRSLWVSVDYEFVKKEYTVSMEIDASFGERWGGGDGYIYLFDYLYKNNKKILHGVKDLLFKDSLSEKDSYYTYLAFDINKDKTRIYSFLKEAIEWIFTQEEIVEVLKGNKWLEGYCPPSPF